MHVFPDISARDSASNSELVVPIIVNDNVVAVLDIDTPNTLFHCRVVQQEMEAVVNVLEMLNW